MPPSLLENATQCNKPATGRRHWAHKNLRSNIQLLHPLHPHTIGILARADTAASPMYCATSAVCCCCESRLFLFECHIADSGTAARLGNSTGAAAPGGGCTDPAATNFASDGQADFATCQYPSSVPVVRCRVSVWEDSPLVNCSVRLAQKMSAFHAQQFCPNLECVSSSSFFKPFADGAHPAPRGRGD